MRDEAEVAPEVVMAAPEPPADDEEEQDEPAAEPVPDERDYRLAVAMKIEQRRNAA
jgi:hypothetical protein